MSVDDTVEIFCGEGEQILQWVGYAACSRLAYRRGKQAHVQMETFLFHLSMIPQQDAS
jgi:hypothetical protein